MAIIGIMGQIGSGKSLYQLQYGLEIANKRCKKLVTNFGINLPALKRYSKLTRQPWLAWLADNNQIAVVDAAQSLAELLHGRKNCVVLLDEAGIFLNSREYSKTPKSLLQDLAQSRKDGNDLFYAAQFDEQVDKQFRLLTQYFVLASGLTQYSPKLRAPALKWKTYFHFTPNAFWRMLGNHKIADSTIQKWLLSSRTDWGPLTPADRLAFEIFDSKARLDTQSSNACDFSLSVPVEHFSRSRLSEIRRTYSSAMALDQQPVIVRPLYGRLLYRRYKSLCSAR